MIVAFEGCCHGELDAIYAQISQAKQHVDLLIIGGDFQAVRNEQDLNCMSVPAKFRQLGDFHKYYSGAAVAPCLTLVIGGNHEASNYFEELPYGGWIAENIYFLGRAGVVQYRGLRIAGLSGIYKEQDYPEPRDEQLPYDQRSLRSVYHTRRTEVDRLQQLGGGKKLDIVVSHDWPAGVVEYGDKQWLLKVKRHFAKDVANNELGSPASMRLLRSLRPKYWLSAHLHVRFKAEIDHEAKVENEDEIELDIDDIGEKEEAADGYKVTTFLAMDKCQKKRHWDQWIEYLDLPANLKRKADEEPESSLQYDPEWLKILQSQVPEKERILVEDLTIPLNFATTSPTQQELMEEPDYSRRKHVQPFFYPNPQHIAFCKLLGIPEIV